jgi:hypothetical protein
MDRRPRIATGLLWLGAFLLIASIIRGESTVMGGVLEGLIPRAMNSARITYDSPTLYVDMGKDPPEYLGTGDDARKHLSADSGNLGIVRVRGRPWIGGGFWAPTRRGVRTYLTFDHNVFFREDTGELLFDPEIADCLRRIALEGLRRDAPDHAWLEPPGLDTAPFDERRLFTTVPVRSSHIFWWGYFWNVCTIATLALAARAFWPRSKNQPPFTGVEPT